MEEHEFEVILERFAPLIKKQMVSLNIYKDFDEFYQIGRIAVWEALKKYDPAKGAFPAFAAITIRGKMLDYLKKENRYEERHVASNVTFENDVGFYWEPWLDRELFYEYLRPLTNKQKIWAIEAILHQKTPAEIADDYGVSREAVKSWRKEALKKLRKRSKFNRCK